MDKRTILAVVLMVVIITVGFSIQNLFITPPPVTAKQKTSQASPAASSIPNEQNSAPIASNLNSAVQPSSTTTNSSGLVDNTLAPDALVPVVDSAISLDPYTYNNGRIKVIIDPNGANLISLKLLEVAYKDGKEPVEMIVPGKDAGLTTRIGSQKGEILSVPFRRATNANKNIVEFYREFQINNVPGKTFKITKRYTFYPEDYMFQLDIGMQNSVNEAIPLGKDGFAYTLSLGPQIGPLSSNILQGQDFRTIVYLNGNDRKYNQLGPRSEFEIPGRVDWAAIEGKYFCFFLVPNSAEFKIKYSTPDRDGKMGSHLDLSRPTISTSNAMDSYRIYAGPKLSNILARYNKSADNQAGQSGLNLDKIVDNGWLWWLEEGLKWVMNIFYMLIPNWGIAIILLTILIKLVMYPLTEKSMESTSKMQALNPQMESLRAKYKDNPAKLNEETAALYKREKINPLGGCLPMLLQFPFFFAMYNLFYHHFELRGAMFIPGWISDLSLPETIIHFSFQMPILGFTVTGLHLLPFLYLGSQFLTTKLTTANNTPGSNAGQMKFMMYGMPAMFFFILYESPAGLLVYWIFQNLLQIVQQRFANYRIARIKAQRPDIQPYKPGQQAKGGKGEHGGKSGNPGKGNTDPKKTK